MQSPTRNRKTKGNSNERPSHLHTVLNNCRDRLVDNERLRIERFERLECKEDDASEAHVRLDIREYDSLYDSQSLQLVERERGDDERATNSPLSLD